LINLLNHSFNYINLRKITIFTICIVYAMLFILPLEETYSPDCNCWVENYRLKEAVYLILYAPFPVLFILYIVRKKTKFMDLVKLLLLILIGFYFLFGLSNVAFVSQDYSPTFGSLLPVTFLPLVICLFFTDWKTNHH